MKNVETYIQKHTHNRRGLVPWLTPDEAREVAKIAKEEVIEEACNAYCKICGHYPHTTPTHICRQACDYYKDFRKILNRD